MPYRMIAQILTVQNEDELARQAIDSIADDADRVTTLISISDAKAKLEERSPRSLGWMRRRRSPKQSRSLPRVQIFSPCWHHASPGTAAQTKRAICPSKPSGNFGDKGREQPGRCSSDTLPTFTQSIGFELSDQERAAVKSLTNQLD